MFPDNDAPDFATYTDRELAEYTAETLHRILTLAAAMHSQVEPVMGKLTKNPLLGGLFR